MTVHWPVVYSATARNDLYRIRSYIAHHLKSPLAAKQTTRLLIHKINALSTFPEMYPCYPHEPWHSRGIRYLTIKNYIVFYYFHRPASEVRIIRIMHRSQHAPTHLPS